MIVTLQSADCKLPIGPDKSAICHHKSAIRPVRPALTLLEVIVSVAIFLFSLVAIGRLVTLGTEHAVGARQLSLATMLCQSKLAEIMTGAEPLNSSGFTPLADNPDWQWRMECSESPETGLWKVQVWVQRQRSDGSTFEATLAQLVLDPLKRGSSLTNSSDTASSGGSP